jgi:hypothetical protein
MARRIRARTPEYRLLITPSVSEGSRKPTTRFVLETTQSFAAFRYDLTVEEHAEPHAVVFRVLGLKTPRLNLPSAGRAQFVREYDHLKGTCQVTVVGLDGDQNTCTVKISPEKVEVLKPPTGFSLSIAANAPQWTHE